MTGWRIGFEKSAIKQNETFVLLYDYCIVTYSFEVRQAIYILYTNIFRQISMSGFYHAGFNVK